MAAALIVHCKGLVSKDTAFFSQYFPAIPDFNFKTNDKGI